MPYIVATKRLAGPQPLGAERFQVNRVAVGSLEEARTEAHRLVNSQPHRLSDPLWNNAIEAWPKSGGSVGPLPDGTTLHVAATYLELWLALPDSKTGIYPSNTSDWPKIIVAFNEAEAGRGR